MNSPEAWGFVIAVAILVATAIFVIQRVISFQRNEPEWVRVDYVITNEGIYWFSGGSVRKTRHVTGDVLAAEILEEHFEKFAISKKNRPNFECRITGITAHLEGVAHG